MPTSTETAHRTSWQHSSESRLTVLWNERDGGQPVITPVEIDLLYAAINEGSDDEQHDWNEDGLFNVTDVDYLLEDVVGTIRGDTNLDGNVDFQDFLNVAGFSGQDAGWGAGDFDGNGTFEFSELLLIFSNFGFDADND